MKVDLRKIFPFLFISYVLSGAETPMGFQEAMDAIVERSTSVGIQKETKESVEARNWSSKYRLLPTVTLSGSEVRTKLATSADEIQKRTYEVIGKLNLFRFGADFAAMSGASNENEAQEYLVSDSLLKAENEAVSALIGYIQSQATVKSLETNLKARDEAWKTGQERSRRGLLAIEEANKLLIDKSNAEVLLQDSENDRISAAQSLERLLSHDRVNLAWPWREQMAKAGSYFAKIDLKALSERPDWKASEKSVDAAHARKRQSLGEALPSVDLSLSYGNALYRKPEPEISGAEWQGMLTLTFPLFDRLSNYGGYRAAVHSAKAEEFRLENIRRTAKAEWGTAKESFLIAYKSATEREKTLEVSRRLYETNTQRFRRGIINANDLMIDQDRLYRAEINAIHGWSAAHLKFLAACHALGLRSATCLKNLGG